MVLQKPQPVRASQKIHGRACGSPAQTDLRKSSTHMVLGKTLLGTRLEMHPWKEKLHARAGTRLRDCGLCRTHTRAATPPKGLQAVGDPCQSRGKWVKCMDCQRETITFQPQPPALPITSLKGLGETEYNAWQKQGKLGPGRDESGVWLKLRWGKEEERCFPKCCLIVYFFFFSQYPNQYSKVCASWQ